MIRDCNAQDIALLKRNKTYFLNGIEEKNRGNGLAPIIISFTIAVILFFVILFLPLILEVDLFGSLMGRFYRIVLKRLCTFLLLAAVIYLFTIIRQLIKHVESNMTKAGILGEKDLRINNGKIVGVAPDTKLLFFVENGLEGPKHRIPVIRYPASASDNADLAEGDKILILYSNETTALVKCATAELEDLYAALDRGIDRELPEAVKTFWTIPHVNALQALETRHKLSREEHAYLNRNFHRAEGKRILYLLAVNVGVCFVVAGFIALINYLDNDDISLIYALYIALAVCTFTIVMFFLLFKKRKADYTAYSQMQRVILDEITLIGAGTNNNGFVSVFEFDGEEFQYRVYENTGNNFIKKPRYGMLLQAYTDGANAKFI